MNLSHLTSVASLGLLFLVACNIENSDSSPATTDTKTLDYDLTLGPAPGEPIVPEGMVEVTLQDNLDGDLNSYCLDIVGGGPNINPANGLQAHTCYSYRGALGSDQAVDPTLYAKGIIKVVAFDVCATAENTEPGAKIALEKCDGRKTQNFSISDSGSISPAGASDLCLTVGEDTKFGRGGTSPHQIKTLSLENCDTAIAARQEWRVREKKD